MQDIPLPWLSGILVLLVMLSAFFSSTETALMSINRYRLRHRAREGSSGARAAEKLLASPDRLIGLILVCNNFVNSAAAAIVGLAGGSFAQQMGAASMALQNSFVMTCDTLANRVEALRSVA